jgi:hypothetical protein
MEQRPDNPALGQTPWDVTAADAAGSEQPIFQRGPVRSAGAWTIPLMCMGIALIACCLLIPAADENRQMTYEGAGLKSNLEQIQKQVGTNEEFLTRMRTDPALAERLAQRQMKMVRAGTNVLELKGQPLRANPSPFLLVTLPPPTPLEPYRPVGGHFAAMCRDPHLQLYMLGAGMMMIATGLVLGRAPE